MARQTLGNNQGYAHFADTGYGELFSTSGFINPAFTANIFFPSFIQINGDVNGLSVVGNSIEGYAYFINSTSQNVVRDWAISSNTIRRTANGVVIFPSSSEAATCLITGNHFDLDPLFESNQRVTSGGAPTGAWNAGSNFFGVLATMNGVIITNNTFMNAQGSWNINKKTFANYFAGNNVLFWDWGTNGSVSLGIGILPDLGQNISYYRHSNPTVGIYGRDEHSTFLYGSSAPSVGYYIEGTFVRNTQPSVSGGKVLLAWVRLTTGDGNVLNTDWTPVYATNS